MSTSGAAKFFTLANLPPPASNNKINGNNNTHWNRYKWRTPSSIPISNIVTLGGINYRERKIPASLLVAVAVLVSVLISGISLESMPCKVCGTILVGLAVLYSGCRAYEAFKYFYLELPVLALRLKGVIAGTGKRFASTTTSTMTTTTTKGVGNNSNENNGRGNNMYGVLGQEEQQTQQQQYDSIDYSYTASASTKRLNIFHVVDNYFAYLLAFTGVSYIIWLYDHSSWAGMDDPDKGVWLIYARMVYLTFMGSSGVTQYVPVTVVSQFWICFIAQYNTFNSAFLFGAVTATFLS